MAFIHILRKSCPPPRRTACALADFTVYKELDFFLGGGGSGVELD